MRSLGRVLQLGLWHYQNNESVSSTHISREAETVKSEIEFLVKLRDGAQMIADATSDYLDSLAPVEVKEKVAVVEITFTVLKFEQQTGAKIGEYEVAYKASNIPEKWQSAFNILNSSNATIQSRYHGKGYEFSYWLYGQDKIYRQKRKGAAPQ